MQHITTAPAVLDQNKKRPPSNDAANDDNDDDERAVRRRLEARAEALAAAAPAYKPTALIPAAPAPGRSDGGAPSPEQARALERMRAGNAAVLGPGGCGKSWLVRRLAAEYERAGRTVAVTSLTGAAALVLNVPGATTLHRWAGIGLGKQSLDETIAKLRYRTYLVERWRNTELLVIDEVSMMSRKLFELLDGVGRFMRREPRLPFGGLRVVVTGDFFQLAPVPDRGSGYGSNGGGAPPPPPGSAAAAAFPSLAGASSADHSGAFCFESPLYAQMFPREAHVLLTQMVRQTGDPAFQSVLAEVREGRCSDATADFLAGRVVVGGAATAADVKSVGAGGGDPPPIKLFPTNAMVDRENEAAYSRVLGPERVYEMETRTDAPRWLHDNSSFNAREAAAVRKAASGDTRRNELQFLQSGLPCAERLGLKVGTAVVLLANLSVEEGLANGSQGTVVRFESEDEVTAAMEVLAAAAAGGGAGGGGAAAGEQPRPRYFFGRLLPPKVAAPPPPRRVAWPVVRFLNGVERAIGPHWWQSATLPCVALNQIPLRHGWARSIHASQGATYDSALADLGGEVFAAAQVYVALSRLRRGDGLRLARFDRLKIRADPRVLAFERWLTGAGPAPGGECTAAPPVAVAPRSAAAPVARIIAAPISGGGNVDWGNDDGYGSD